MSTYVTVVRTKANRRSEKSDRPSSLHFIDTLEMHSLPVKIPSLPVRESFHSVGKSLYERLK